MNKERNLEELKNSTFLKELERRIKLKEIWFDYNNTELISRDFFDRYTFKLVEELNCTDLEKFKEKEKNVEESE